MCPILHDLQIPQESGMAGGSLFIGGKTEVLICEKDLYML